MIDGLLIQLAPVVPPAIGEPVKPAAPATEGFSEALALLLAPQAPGVPVDAAVGDAVALPVAAAVPDAAAVTPAGDDSAANRADVRPAMVRSPLMMLRPVAANGVVPGPAVEGAAAADPAVPRVAGRAKSAAAAPPLAEPVEMPTAIDLPPMLVMPPAAPELVITPTESPVARPLPVPLATGVVTAVPPLAVGAEVAKAPAALAMVAVAAAPVIGRATPADAVLPPVSGQSGGDSSLSDAASGGEMRPEPVATALLSPAIDVGRSLARTLTNGPATENPALPERFAAVLPLAAKVAAAVPERRSDGTRREFDAVPVAEPVVSGAASVGLPGVLNGNPVVRGGSGEALPIAPAIAEQQLSVASEVLGPVDVGVDGGDADLRVRFSADAAAARVMAAEAPRLLADLAAQGVRVQALAFDGRVEAGAEPGFAGGSGGNPAQQSPGHPGAQPGGQPGFAAGRRLAALPESAVTASAAGTGRPRISERYA